MNCLEVRATSTIAVADFLRYRWLCKMPPSRLCVQTPFVHRSKGLASRADNSSRSRALNQLSAFVRDVNDLITNLSLASSSASECSITILTFARATKQKSGSSNYANTDRRIFLTSQTVRDHNPTDHRRILAFAIWPSLQSSDPSCIPEYSSVTPPLTR